MNTTKKLVDHLYIGKKLSAKRACTFSTTLVAGILGEDTAQGTVYQYSHALASLASTHAEDAGEVLRTILGEIQTVPVPSTLIDSYRLRNPDKSNKLSAEGVEGQLRRNWTTAAVNAVRRKLQGGWVLEISKEHDIADKAIVFRAKTDAELQTAAAEEKAQKSAKKSAENKADLENQKKVRELSGTEQVIFMLAVATELKHDDFESMLAGMLKLAADRDARYAKEGVAKPTGRPSASKLVTKAIGDQLRKAVAH